MLRLRETVRKRTVSRKLSMTGLESLCLGSFALLGGWGHLPPTWFVLLQTLWHTSLHPSVPTYTLSCWASRSPSLAKGGRVEASLLHRWGFAGEGIARHLIQPLALPRRSVVRSLVRFADLPQSCQVPFFAKFRLTSPFEGKHKFRTRSCIWRIRPQITWATAGSWHWTWGRRI